MSRKVAREEAMKLLYQMEINRDFSIDALNFFLKNRKLDEDEIIYITETVSTIIENKNKIDVIIKDNLHDWKIDRLAKIDLSIMRIALYEILYCKDIPTEVSINEAIEIGKKYSTSDSSKFINGVLGAFVRKWNDSNEQ